jgi:hypothetical protein
MTAWPMPTHRSVTFWKRFTTRSGCIPVWATCRLLSSSRRTTRAETRTRTSHLNSMSHPKGAVHWIVATVFKPVVTIRASILAGKPPGAWVVVPCPHVDQAGRSVGQMPQPADKPVRGAGRAHPAPHRPVHVVLVGAGQVAQRVHFPHHGA